MGSIVVVNHQSTDGVMQGPGRSDEDPRDGFAYGGWGGAYGDDELGETLGRGMEQTSALLLGRRTYEDFYSYWPKQTDNPYTEILNDTRKYVVSTTLTEPLPWQNSTLLAGDVADSVARVRDASEGGMVVLGSGELVRSLNEHDLVDRYVLALNPLLLGQGRRLFPEAGPRRNLSLIDTVVTSKGVIVATYGVERDDHGRTR